MGHKTLIGGTSYDVSGGITLVSGTSYSVQGGKVLVNGTAYDISFFLPPAALELWKSTSNTNSASISCIAYGNGYWVVGGSYYDGSQFYARIAYATSLDGVWSIKDLWSGATSNLITCTTYGNGYWVVGGQYFYNTSLQYAYISYATSPNGTWTNKQIWSSSSYPDLIHCITYANGYWVVGGQYADMFDSSACIAYATSLDGTWTRKDLWNCNNVPLISSIVYARGTFVVGGKYYNGSKYCARIAYATSLGGTWTTRDLWSSNSSETYIYCITYGNYYWVVGGQYYDGSTYYARIAYTTDLGLTWVAEDLWSSQHAKIVSLSYGGGCFVAGGRYYANKLWQANLAYASTPGGTWTTKKIWSYASSSVLESLASIIYAEGGWIAGGHTYNYSNHIAYLKYSPSLDGFDEI